MFLSKRKSDFDYVKPNYQDALKKSHYDHELKHCDSKDRQAKKGKKRRRKIIYFQPPFSLTVKTPIGKSFLKLIKKHFHPKHPLHKILNHRCIKLSYSCLGNIKSEIASSNKSLMCNKEKNPKLCNCRKPEDCPLDGKCLIKNIIYKAEITSGNNESKVYIGSAGNDFKQRYTNHKSSLKYSSKRKTTELSKFYWELKDAGITPAIKWSIIKEIRSGYSLKNGCTLCNTEKYLIACAEKRKLLNKRNELKRVCPHYSSAFFWFNLYFNDWIYILIIWFLIFLITPSLLFCLHFWVSSHNWDRTACVSGFNATASGWFSYLLDFLGLSCVCWLTFLFIWLVLILCVFVSYTAWWRVNTPKL